jgi:uncharacterized protein (TIGR00251 family)
MPFTAVADGIRARVRLTPKAARDRIQGVVRDADGMAALKVAVTAPPEKGKANVALVKLLAREWRVPKSDLTLIAGHRDRRKVVHLTGDPDRLAAALADWLAGIADGDALR